MTNDNNTPDEVNNVPGGSEKPVPADPFTAPRNELRGGLYSEILPGLWQGGTHDDDGRVIHARGHVDSRPLVFARDEDAVCGRGRARAEREARLADGVKVVRAHVDGRAGGRRNNAIVAIDNEVVIVDALDKGRDALRPSGRRPR